MRGEKGFALVITLIVTALLVAVASDLIHDVFIETSLRQSFADAQQASLAAASGADVAVALLNRSLGTRAYTSLQDPWATPQKLDDERGSLTVTITEENGKLDLNSIVQSNGTVNEAYLGVFQRLLERMDLPPDLADKLVDWIDPDDAPRARGAETGYYKTLPTPYNAANAPLYTYEELRMAAGFDEATLTKLFPYVTVYGDSSGGISSKVNINTAPAELLAVLDPQMTSDLAARIVEYRKTAPLKSPSEVTGIPGLETVGISLQGRIDVKGSVFRIQSRAQVKDTVRIVETVVRIGGTEPVILYWREL
ncbi:MAG: type II secretion system minor pseudopilin GspK [Geobacteraceae bacterium]|nr:type II secretion system minor pseudopilin GspK [Geobacteraceae bacterium]